MTWEWLGIGVLLAGLAALIVAGFCTRDRTDEDGTEW